MWRRLLFGCNNIKLDSVLNKIQDNLTLTCNGVTILQLHDSIYFNFFFSSNAIMPLLDYQVLIWLND